MANETLAVVYRPNEHADEYLVFVEDEAEYKAWKAQPEGGKDIALARFIGNFNIYKSNTGGATGLFLTVGKQDIESEFFGDDKKVKDKSVDAAIAVILANGREKTQKFQMADGNTNPSRGEGNVRAGGNHSGR